MDRVYSVGQVNTYIRRLLSGDYALSRIAVKGEVSNVKYHSSGHIYFTIKDDRGAMRCVMFSSDRMRGLTFVMQDGQSVIVRGRIDVYERDGTYQLYAKEIALDGAGILYERFEQLKQKLDKEGLFDFEHKKPIPRFVKTVGIVTAQTGAAIRDIQSIARRRNPYVQLYLYPALVQGDGAAQSIVKGIRTLDKMHLDVLIIGRGGGSIEDLWAFNEECVARAIYDANTPIISGTGHEIDMTIADYVADKRAATPSAACELAVYEYQPVKEQLEKDQKRLEYAVRRKFLQIQQQIRNYELQIQQMNPQVQLQKKRTFLEESQKHLNQLMTTKAKAYEQQRIRLFEKMQSAVQKKLIQYQHDLEVKTAALHGLSPTAKLMNGYGYVTKQGRPVKDITRIKADSEITITMAKGSRKAKVI